MYIREILPSRGSPIEDGIALQGTWTRAFEEVDLLDIHRPYRYPLPRWIRDNRIKEWETFIIQDDRFYLEAILSNLKMYRMAQVFLYDKNTLEQFTFRKVIPGSGWRLPRSLYNTSMDSRSYGFFFRIHNWLDADTIKLDLDIEAARRRPAFTAHAEFDLNRGAAVPMVVSLSFTGQRNMYAFKAFTAVRGDVVFGGKHMSFNPEKCSGFFHDYKGFYPYRLRMVWCNGMGFDGEGRRFGFSIVENQTRETHKNNENALWINGELTPLPPVRITMPEGIESDWIIQDLEGMVDLVFTPREQVRSGINILVTHTEYETPLGYYNGMLVNSGGEQIMVRNLWGMGEKLYLRV
ncbi:MAG: DUF2804 domain-containing protein [Treponema sp.]|jgi:hypothetical protein|nr:DUF2804 domain-containing protein [Treponema sp.]